MIFTGIGTVITSYSIHYTKLYDYVAIAEGNYNVTGGTIEIQTLSAATFDMYTTIPLYNLNVVEGVGTQAVTIVDQNGNTSQASSLTVLNDIV